MDQQQERESPNVVLNLRSPAADEPSGRFEMISYRGLSDSASLGPICLKPLLRELFRDLIGDLFRGHRTAFLEQESATLARFVSAMIVRLSEAAASSPALSIGIERDPTGIGIAVDSLGSPSVTLRVRYPAERSGSVGLVPRAVPE